MVTRLRIMRLSMFNRLPFVLLQKIFQSHNIFCEQIGERLKCCVTGERQNVYVRMNVFSISII